METAEAQAVHTSEQTWARYVDGYIQHNRTWGTLDAILNVCWETKDLSVLDVLDDEDRHRVVALVLLASTELKLRAVQKLEAQAEAEPST